MITIRYDTIRQKSLTWTQKLNLAHVVRKKYKEEETKTNIEEFITCEITLFPTALCSVIEYAVFWYYYNDVDCY